MPRYYTRVCNFYYGKNSKNLILKKKTLPLHGNKTISFDRIEIISRDTKRNIQINEINKLPNNLKKKIKQDLKSVTKKKYFKNLPLNSYPKIMGILNITPDSFSDGGKYNKTYLAEKQLNYLFKKGANLVDIGGESTRPGAKPVSSKVEWDRIKGILKRIDKRKLISLDTRKSEIMEKGIKLGVKLINDVSGLSYDNQTIEFLKKFKIPFVLQHSQGTAINMQQKPTYKNELLDIYDFFEKKIEFLRSFGINHRNIIIDPGIGFGKNLKHNMSLIKNISIFHSLGFPILVGNSRKKFIKELSKKNDTKERIGGTIASSIYLMMHGVQILRIHDVNEVQQAIKVFKAILNN
ncbi:dihydropteroate synthase [Candidatus Pelagibacter sp.]|nr:dihydropteroate synthase [Candidatus Pelagibacter sp.]